MVGEDWENFKCIFIKKYKINKKIYKINKKILTRKDKGGIM